MQLLLKRNYDTVASFYDRAARLIFGSTQHKAQLYLLNAVKPCSHLLVIGGGSGRILEDIARRYPRGLSITYVDASAKMMAHAARRYTGENHVTFITANIEQAVLAGPYDAVLTPFLFDNVTTTTARSTCDKVYGHMVPGSVWLYCDFEYTGAVWQRVLLKAMYAFFRLCCGIEASSLPDMARCFTAERFRMREERYFYRWFIVARVYEKLPTD